MLSWQWAIMDTFRTLQALVEAPKTQAQTP